MPAVFLFTSHQAAAVLNDGAFDTAAILLAKNVSFALGLKPEQVSVDQLTPTRSLNAPHLRVICMASGNEKRLEKIDQVRDTIRETLITLADSYPQCSSFFEVVGHSESWVIMPPGSWVDFPIA